MPTVNLGIDQLLLLSLLLLLYFGLSAFAIYKSSADRRLSGGWRVVLILLFLTWPIIAPLIYLFLFPPRTPQGKRNISFR